MNDRSRRRRQHRLGSTLVELLAALPLLALAAGVALLLLLHTAADYRLHEHGQRHVRERRHAHAILHADLAPLVGAQLRHVSDSLLAIHSQLAVAVVCHADAAGLLLTLPVGETNGAPLDVVRRGDSVRIWATPAATGATPTAQVMAVAAPSRRLGAGACGHAAAGRRWHVPVEPSAPPGDLLVGSPATVLRDVQYVHYRSYGHWWMGRRTRDANGWDVVQPVAGPLESPAQGGMRIAALSADGAPAAALEDVAMLRVRLRSPPATTSRTRRLVEAGDSLAFDVTLRAASWSRGRR